MATQVQFRRGTTTQNNAFTGAIAELTVDTEAKTLRLHDGSTAGGGAVIATLAGTQTFTNKTHSSNSVWQGTAVGLAYGGTNANLTAVAGGVIYSGASALAISAAGTSGQVLTSAGASAPTWTAQSSLVVGTATVATTATNIAGGSAGNLIIQLDTNQTTFVAAGAAGTFLKSTGASTAPEFAAGQITIGSTATSFGDTSTSLAGVRSITMGNGSHGGATVGTITGSGPWTATLTGISSTTGIMVGQNITATDGTGSLFGGSPTSVLVASIVSGTSITVTVTGGTTPTAGTITSLTTFGFLQVPTGTTAQRPWVPANGMIRYNSTQSTFEGYSSSAWSSLGGVKSVDGYTYIQAETSAGASNGDLDFYAENAGGNGATQVGQWNRTNLKDYTGTLVGTQTTQNVFNATATTVNAFGAATALNLGAATGTLTVANTTLAAKAITASTTLAVTGATTLTGALAANGGITVDSTAFVVADTTGNVSTTGTLTVTGATVLNGGLTMDTDKFTVADTTGNTAIGGTLAVTGNQTNTGDLAVNGGDITTTATTFNLLNATATTLNIGGAATTVSIGAATGTATINNAEVVISGNLSVNGTTTTINSTTLTVDDKNIELGSVGTPSDVTADGGGITLKGATDKTLNWVNATDAWTSSEHIALAAGKTLIVGGSSSGTTTVTASAAASGTLTLPAATDTLVGKATTDTLTNKSISLTNNTVTFTSLELKTACSDETGSGALVFATSPTLVTPTLGVASATSVNKLTITAPATGSTLTIADGKTLTASNTLTFTGTDASSVAFGAGGTVLYSGGALGTPSSGTLTNATGLPVSGITASTSTALGVGSIELGHATDTTIARSSAGVISVEGVIVPTVSSTNTLTNKTLTFPVIDNIKMGYTTTATAAGTTTLTATSNQYQRFTGSTTQTIVLPVTSTLATGVSYEIENASTGNLTVNSSGGNLVITIIPGVSVQCMCIGTSLTTAADWDAEYNEFSTITGTGSNVLATSPTLVTPTLGAATATSINGLTITSSTGTLTVANGKTLTASNTLTFTGTDASSVAFGAGGTVLYAVPNASTQVSSLGIGTAASGTTGEIRATNNITAYYSDARLKDFAGTIPNALDKVLALNGYYFTENAKAKELGYNNDARQVGVSAQEVEAVLPEIVADAPINGNFPGADYKTVHYEKLVPLLIEAIKEQQKQIEELKAKLGN